MCLVATVLLPFVGAKMSTGTSIQIILCEGTYLFSAATCTVRTAHDFGVRCPPRSYVFALICLFQSNSN